MTRERGRMAGLPVPVNAGWLDDLAPESILRRKDVAGLFGVSVRTVDGWVAKGMIPPAAELASAYAYGKPRTGWTAREVRRMIENEVVNHGPSQETRNF